MSAHGAAEAYTDRDYTVKDAKGRSATIKGASNIQECFATSRRLGFSAKQIANKNNICHRLFPGN
jgi:hypothetical protein